MTLPGRVDNIIQEYVRDIELEHDENLFEDIIEKLQIFRYDEELEPVEKIQLQRMIEHDEDCFKPLLQVISKIETQLEALSKFLYRISDARPGFDTDGELVLDELEKKKEKATMDTLQHYHLLRVRETMRGGNVQL